jgi:putative chitinase
MLRQPALFFMAVRGTVLGPVLTQSETDGCNAILTAMEGAPIAHVAYALATAYHETAHTLQPITECGGPAYFARMYDPAPTGRRPEVAKRLGNTRPGDGALYCGRGYVQLTGRDNYGKAGRDLNLPLGAHPEMALRPEVAAKIMHRGMDEGWFTGYGFDAFLPSSRTANTAEFINARRIINGIDRSSLIAGYAVEFQQALEEGGWA